MYLWEPENQTHAPGAGNINCNELLSNLERTELNLFVSPPPQERFLSSLQLDIWIRVIQSRKTPFHNTKL